MTAIVYKKPGQLVANGYWLKALKNNTGGMGFAVQSDGVIEIERSIEHQDIAALEEIQRSFKEQAVVFCLHDNQKPLKPEDVMPYIALGDEKSPSLICFGEGKFLNFIPSGGDAHLNEFWMFNKFIIPKLRKLYAASDSDMDKLFKELNDPLTATDYINPCGDHGSIFLINAGGNVLLFDKNHLKREYDWGSVSRHYDYKEESAAPAAAVVEPEKKLTMLEKLKLKKAAATASPIIASVEPIQQPDLKATTVIPANTGTPVPQDDVWYEPPEEIRGSNNAIKRAYRQEVGWLPQNWKECPKVQRSSKKITARLKKEQQIKGENPIKDFKDLPKDKIKTVAPDVSGILSPKLREAIEEEFGKNLDASSQEIVDPAKLAESEVNLPDFFEQCPALNVNTTDHWNRATLLDFARKYPEGFVRLFEYYRLEGIVNRDEDDVDDTDTVDTSGTGTIKSDATPRKWVHPSKRVAM